VNRAQLLAAEIFGYSFANYAEHLGICGVSRTLGIQRATSTCEQGWVRHTPGESAVDRRVAGCFKGKRVKRASTEYSRTVRVWREHLAWHGAGPLACVCEFQIGRFRKGQRVWGCGKARCYLCHGDKLLKRPTRKQHQANTAYREWLRELHNR